MITKTMMETKNMVTSMPTARWTRNRIMGLFPSLGSGTEGPERRHSGPSCRRPGVMTDY